MLLPRAGFRSGLLAAPFAALLAGCGSTLHVSVPSVATATSSSATSSAAPSAPTSSTGGTTSPGSPSTESLPGAQQILQQAQSAVDKAHSARLVASHSENGSTQTIEIAGTLDGTNESVVFDKQPGGVHANFRMVNARVYVNGNAAYFRTSGATSARAEQLAGKWVSIPASRVRNYSDLTIGGLLRELRTDLDEAASTLTVSRSEDNGQPIWKLTDARTLVAVLADGSARLLTAEHTSVSGDKQRYAFDQWDAVPLVLAPSNPITT